MTRSLAVEVIDIVFFLCECFYLIQDSRGRCLKNLLTSRRYWSGANGLCWRKIVAQYGGGLPTVSAGSPP